MMSTLDSQRSTFIPRHDPVTFAGVVRSEFIKLTSLRANLILLMAVVVLGIGVSMALALTMEGAGLPSNRSIPFMLDQITVGTILFGQLIVGVMGVLAMSGEYASGTIRSTLAAVPSRLSVLAAKAIVLFLTVTVTGFVSLLGSWALTYPLFAQFDLEIGIVSPEVALPLLGGGVFLGLSAVLGLGVGALLRSVAASVATVISLVFLVPLVLSVLPFSPAIRNFHLLTMSKAGDAIVGTADPAGGFVSLTDGYVSPVAGLILAVVWAGVLLVAGAVRLRRGDA